MKLQKEDGMKHSKLQLQVRKIVELVDVEKLSDYSNHSKRLLMLRNYQVLSLYKECMRAAQLKPGFEQTVRTEFKRNAALPR